MVIRPLSRKLLRDLSRLKGQVITIALVVGAGIASLVGLGSTVSSLADSRDAYYLRYRFAQVFAHAERAPESLTTRIEAIPGVARAYTRITEEVRLQPEGPAGAQAGWSTGRLVSLPETGEPPLNSLHLRSGRWPEAGRVDEVLLLEAFADAYAVKPGHQVRVVMNGKLRHLRVVGTALSPEFVYALRPGAISDEFGRYGVLWMSRRALAGAFDQQASFNDVSLALQPGASEAAVVHALDRLLEPYGGLGAIGRDQQPSNNTLESELAQLAQMATWIPAIFLAVAAFLVNVVLSRLVSLQRPEIAALKALGYTNREIARHFLGLVVVTVALGAIVGTAAGASFGRWMTDLYASFFHFPVLKYRLGRELLAVSILVSITSAGAGAWVAIRSSVRLPPAEAMRPPAPPSYRLSRFERGPLGRLLGTTATMIFRESVRRPLRTMASALGIGAAVGVVILGRFNHDSLEHLLSVLLLQQQREDLSVTFMRSVPAEALAEVELMPGVLTAEGIHAVPVRIFHGGRHRDIPLLGLTPGGELRQIVESTGRVVPPPDQGLLLTRKLAELLGVSPGGIVELEEREGARRRWRVPVQALADEGMGLQAYLSLPELHRLRGEQPRLTTILLRIDPRRRAELVRRLERSPRMASVDSVQAMVGAVRAQSGKYMTVITGVITIFAACIAVGVVYNNARVTLSQRARDLATLRVLGFSRAEVSSVLLGELALQVAIGVPLGVALGYAWAWTITLGFDPERMRLPVVVGRDSLLMAIGLALLSAVVSGLWVRRRLDRLDLIAVLKTRE